jgi:hypothetical protein
VPDLFVEIRAVLVLDDAAAFLTDRLVELRAMTLARRLATRTDISPPGAFTFSGSFFSD